MRNPSLEVLRQRSGGRLGPLRAAGDAVLALALGLLTDPEGVQPCPRIAEELGIE